MSDNRPVYELNGGVAKILRVYEDRCVLSSQKNLMSFLTQNLMNGDKEFYYENLTSIQHKQASRWINGYIQFEYPGSHSSANDFNSENSFAFQLSKLDNEKVNSVVEYIRGRIRDARKPKAPVAVISPAEELKKYKELLDMGVISQEEFDTKKKQILGL